MLDFCMKGKVGIRELLRYFLNVKESIVCEPLKLFLYEVFHTILKNFLKYFLLIVAQCTVYSKIFTWVNIPLSFLSFQLLFSTQ